MMEIVTGKVANPARTAAMMELLKRDYTKQTSDTDDQGRGFTGMALQVAKAFVCGPKQDGRALRDTTSLTSKCLTEESLSWRHSPAVIRLIARSFPRLRAP